jgi:hypothetical protein
MTVAPVTYREYVIVFKPRRLSVKTSRSTGPNSKSSTQTISRLARRRYTLWGTKPDIQTGVKNRAKLNAKQREALAQVEEEDKLNAASAERVKKANEQKALRREEKIQKAVEKCAQHLRGLKDYDLIGEALQRLAEKVKNKKL